MLALNNTPIEQQGQTQTLAGLTLQMLELALPTSQFDLLLALQHLPGMRDGQDRQDGQISQVDQDGQAGGGAGARIAAQLSYRTSLFQPETIARWVGHWQTLLQHMVASTPGSVQQLRVLERSQWQQIVHEFNRPRWAMGPTLPALHQVFEQQAARQPDAPALVYQESKLSYAQLNARSNQLAHYLLEMMQSQASCAGVPVRVALLLERGMDWVVAILAVLKSGAAYVPMEPGLPQQRLAFLLQDARPQLVLSSGGLNLSGLTNTTNTTMATEATEAATAATGPAPDAPLWLTMDDASIAQQSTANPVLPALSLHDLAYIIYTSGSTGLPKGVLVEHGQLARLMSATWHGFGFDQTSVWTLFHSYAFDFSVWEIWGALVWGGKLVVVPALVARTPQQFYQLLLQEKVTVLNQTPSALRQLIQYQANLLNNEREDEGVSQRHRMYECEHCAIAG